jgi:chaperonin GroEL (HSP60 family)
MENEAKKNGRGKNVVSEKDMGDYILQTRRVERRGMTEPKEYDLKIPKTEKAWEAIYGAGSLLSKGIASLKTENDDSVEQSGKPISEDQKIKAGFKTATEEQKAQIAKILGISSEEAGKKIEETKKNMKAHGFGK